MPNFKPCYLYRIGVLPSNYNPIKHTHAYVHAHTGSVFGNH